MDDMGLEFSEKEKAVISEISNKQELRPAKVIKRALAVYQLIVMGSHELREINPGLKILLAEDQGFAGEQLSASSATTEPPRVFIDMDGVVVDFDGYKNMLNLTGDEVKRRPGAFLEMSPMPHAIDSIRTLIKSGFDVWLATKPPTGLASAYSEKAQWVFQHLPELKRKLIITHDKGLLGCERDFLIDDRPHKANCRKFLGTLIEFKDGMTWERVLDIVYGSVHKRLRS